MEGKNIESGGREKSIREIAEETITRFKENGGVFISSEAEKETLDKIQQELARERYGNAIPFLHWDSSKDEWTISYEPEDLKGANGKVFSRKE